jgi:Tfp pilus assembly protein PilF
VLEGSVARAADRLRVRVQLVDAQTGYTLWSETFDRAAQDVFAVQEEIALTVAEALLGAPRGGERAGAMGGTSNHEAYELYLAAKANTNGAHENLGRGLEQIDRALELDPNFALAWAQKARILNRLQVRQSPPVHDAQTAAEQAALRALELEPRLGYAHTALGAALMMRRERSRAAAAFREGLALGNREDTEVYGLFLMSVGHISRAREYLSMVKARDPLNAEASAWLAATYEHLGNTAAAFAELERGRQLFDHWESGLGTEILARLATGNADEVQMVPELYPELEALLRPFAPLLESLDDPAAAFDEVRAQYAREPRFVAYLLAVAAMLDQPEFAAEGFADQVAKRQAGVGSSSGIFWAHVFRDMRRLPRFEQLVRDEGLVDFWREHGWPDLCRPLGGGDFECF